MNYWTDLSVQFPNQRNYLDELFAVYPLAPDVIRQLDETTWQQVEAAFKARDDEQLLQNVGAGRFSRTPLCVIEAPATATCALIKKYANDP